MKNVLVLGAGLVSRPLVGYLLDQQDTHVRMASRTLRKAKIIIDNHPHGEALEVNVKDETRVENLVSESDVVVSLLPYTYHVPVAKMCLKHGCHLVTTSYVSDAMQELDSMAQDAGLLFLNEIGLDPGIDHMSAMKIIHDIHGKDGTITSFTSHCGVLPSPDANTNPYGYKFSWSPRGVLLASRNPARYLKKGTEIKIPGEKLFMSYTFHNIPGIGYLEGYPNRDSVSYRDKYGIPEVQTLLRGTLRYIGWCELMKAIGNIGLLDLQEHPGIQGMTHKQFISSLIGGNTNNPQDSLAEYLKIPAYSAVIKKLEWLGLFDDTPLPPDTCAPLDILAERMLEKLSYGPGERDMAVLHHEFQAMIQGKKQLVTSTFIDYGVPQGDSAVARTVALPAAIGTKLILQEQISLQGVRIPIHPEIYRPVLQELETLGIIFTETTQPPP